MRKFEPTELSALVAQYSDVRERIKSFDSHVRGAQLPGDAPGRVEVNDHRIKVQCYGNDFEANPRVVKSATGELCAEYCFYYKNDGIDVPVCAFYLSMEGVVYCSSDLNDTSRVADFNNSFIASKILTMVGILAADSSLFQPVSFD